MKYRHIILFAATLLVSAVSSAQNGTDYWKRRYDIQVRNLGAAGVGVETIIDRWEAELPEDPEAKQARFTFCFAKSHSVTMIRRSQPRYLGHKPALTLKDSLGTDVYYFEDDCFDEEYFAEALKAIDQAISLEPVELRYTLDKISALMAYEKESPDMAYGMLCSLLDKECKEHPKWKLDGLEAAPDVVEQAMQEYCFSLYNVASEQSYKMFYELSLRLSKVYPKSSVFVSNIGTYWFVAMDNPKKAKKFYNKALKIDPEDYSARRNLEIIQSLQSQKGQSSK